jgi:hypothetical protein
VSLIYSMLGEVVSFSATPAVADRRGRRRDYGRIRRCMLGKNKHMERSLVALYFLIDGRASKI